MNPKQKISVNGLMDWCDLDGGRYRMRSLKILESELNYMKKQGYLGDWMSGGGSASLVECTNPFELLLTLTPPQWLGAELAQIQANRELPPIENWNHKIITCKELNTIFARSNLSVREFGNKIGLTHTMVHFLLKGKRLISKEVSEKIEKFQKTLTS